MKPLVRTLAATLAAAALALLPTSGALAHEGDGVLTVENAEPDGTTVNYVVRLTWANDGHAALNATITGAAIPTAGGNGPAPVQLTAIDQDGRYEGTLTFPNPGDWTVRFTAVEPESTLDRPQSITAPTTTTTSETTTTTAQASPETDDVAAQQTTDDDGFPWLPVITAAAVLAGIGGGAAVALRRRQT